MPKKPKPKGPKGLYDYADASYADLPLQRWPDGSTRTDVCHRVNHSDVIRRILTEKGIDAKLPVVRNELLEAGFKQLPADRTIEGVRRRFKAELNPDPPAEKKAKNNLAAARRLLAGAGSLAAAVALLTELA